MTDLVRKMDADESIFFAKQLETIVKEALMVDYPDLKGRLFVPKNSRTAPGTQTIVYHQYNQVGLAKLITAYADDLPRVDIKGQKFTAPVESIGDAFGYSLDEIDAARLAGVSLESMKMAAAREAMERKLDSLIAFGDANTGLTGFLNNANVSKANASAAWSTLTPDQIVADINGRIQAIIDVTNNVEVPDTLLLPPAEYARLAQTRMTDGNETILSFLLRTSPYLTNIDQWWRLKTAGQAGTTRAVFYKNSPDKLEMHVPLEFQMLAPEARNLEVVVNCRMKVGGVTVYKPLSMIYHDAI